MPPASASPAPAIRHAATDDGMPGRGYDTAPWYDSGTCWWLQHPSKDDEACTISGKRTTSNKLVWCECTTSDYSYEYRTRKLTQQQARHLRATLPAATVPASTSRRLLGGWFLLPGFAAGPEHQRAFIDYGHSSIRADAVNSSGRLVWRYWKR